MREITFDVIARFVESEARALNHPIFGNASGELKSQGKDSKKRKPRHGDNFATLGDENVSESNKDLSAGADPTKTTSKCHWCKGDHRLTRCREFKKQPLEQRLTFVRKYGLCENVFQPGHTLQSYPKNSYCKITSCRKRHLTFLHPKALKRDDANLPSNEIESDENAAGNNNGIAKKRLHQQELQRSVVPSSL